MAAASQNWRSPSAPATASDISANMFSRRSYIIDASARASSSGAPTAQHPSAKYEYGSSYQGGALGPAATRPQVPNETANRMKHRISSSPRPVGRPRFSRVPPAAPAVTTCASSSAQLSVRTSRSGASDWSCVTDT
eukprot:scaffold31781_cov152-Isochrysis_galbana.AAC.2